VTKPDDLEYYRQRAVVERQRASTAPTPLIAAIHERLAASYEELVEGRSTPPILQIVPLSDQG
jgi:hypothetical protein